MNENEGILELVEMLYNMISEAWGVPLGQDKCLVDRDKALDLIEEIKNQLPAEITEARRLVSRRDEFIQNAKKEGESIRKMAETQARKLVDEQEVVRQAEAKAKQLVATAESRSREIQKAMNEYVDETLRSAEESANQALEIVRKSRSKFRSAAASYMSGSREPSQER